MPAATFLNVFGQIYRQRVEQIWLTFINTRSNICTIRLNRIKTDWIPSFQSERWEQLTHLIKAELSLPALRADSSVDSGKRLYEQLRSIYQNLGHYHQSIFPKLFLDIASKDTNYTTKEYEFNSSELEFWILSRFSIIYTNLPVREKKKRIIKSSTDRDGYYYCAAENSSTSDPRYSVVCEQAQSNCCKITGIVVKSERTNGTDLLQY